MLRKDSQRKSVEIRKDFYFLNLAKAQSFYELRPALAGCDNDDY